ncbi:MAG: diguanylate cyclase domain-containing protein, partial [Mycobacteriales bacterium]
EKHPQLGERIRDTWSEIWHVVGPMLQGVLDTREATWAEDQQLWIDRLGFPEDTYFTFSYSPVLDEQHRARGVLATAVETTDKVVAARRSQVLAAVRPGDAVGPAAAAGDVLGQLADHAEDVPFALVYLTEPDGSLARAACSLPDGAWAPAEGQVWPLHLVGADPLVVEVPAGLVVQHASSGAAVRQVGLVALPGLGVLVCGLSPGRRVDAAHVEFLAALGAQVQAALTVARALADLRDLAEEQLAAERALAAQEVERQRRAAEERSRFVGARIGMWSADLVTREVEVDDNLERMFGAEPGSLTTIDAVLDRIAPEDRQRVVDALSEVARTGGEYVTDYRVTQPDGSHRAFQARGTTVPEEGGPAVALHGAVWDATEVLEAQAAMRAADEQLRTALEAAPWGSAIVEPDGRVVRVNRALCTLLGRTRDELLELPFQALLHPGDEPGLDDGGSGVVREVRLLGAGDVPTWVSLSSAPVRDDQGRVLHFVVHVHDLTERKQMEADLTQLADHDVLTGLLSRRRFAEELEQAVKGAGRFGGGAVLMIDMDGLKHANDTYGHSVGDALLVALADTLRGRLRETDVSARLGGDEFAVILPGADELTAQAVAAELLGDLGRMAPLGTRLSASIGITLLGGPDRDRTAEDVITEADMAMYAAKDAGAGQVRTFRAAPSRQPAFRPRRWTDRIRTALESDGFVLHA